MFFGSVNPCCGSLPAVKLATMGTALVHKLARGLPPWAPLKGHSIKSYKQIQSEAIEKREREKAVLRQNDGVWPGESTPAHAMFLWAGGSELTDILEQSTKQNMPHKFISYEVRYFLPGGFSIPFLLASFFEYKICWDYQWDFLNGVPFAVHFFPGD
jgi:hypothetical protein